MTVYLINKAYLTTMPAYVEATSDDELRLRMQELADAKRNSPIGRVGMTCGRHGIRNFFFVRDHKTLNFCKAIPNNSIKTDVPARTQAFIDGERRLPPKLGGGLFTHMSNDAQMRLVNYILNRPQLCTEFVHSALNVAPAEEIDELITEINKTEERLDDMDLAALNITPYYEQGRDAYIRHVHRATCPHADGPKRTAWLDGWDALHKETADHLARMKSAGYFTDEQVAALTRIHKEGHDARVNMLQRTSCRYPDTSRECAAWLDGWDEAAEEADSTSQSDQPGT